MIIVHGSKCAIRCERGGMNANGNVCTRDGVLWSGCQQDAR